MRLVHGQAEEKLLGKGNKEYLPIQGLAAFNKATADLLLGPDNAAIKEVCPAHYSLEVKKPTCHQLRLQTGLSTPPATGNLMNVQSAHPALISPALMPLALFMLIPTLPLLNFLPYRFSHTSRLSASASLLCQLSQSRKVWHSTRMWQCT